jgi:PAS domain S-box-containing protein
MPRARSLRYSRYAGWLLFGAALVVLVFGLSGEATALGTAGIALLALGIVAQAAGPGLATRVISMLALAIAVVAVIGTLPVMPMHMPALVAAILVAGAAGLMGPAWGSREVAHVALGVSGLTLMAIGVTALFVRAVGLFDLYPGRGFGEIPLALVFTALVVGLVFIALVWWDSPDPTAYSDMALPAVAVAGLVASALLWRALVVHEEFQLSRLTTHEAQAAARAIERSVDASRRVLTQFALRSEVAPAVDGHPAVLAQLLRDTPGVDLIALLDSTGHPVAVLPDGRDAGAISAAVPPRATGRAIGGQGQAAYLRVPGDTSRFVIHAARCVAGACPGGVAALISTTRLRERAVGDRGGWIYQLGPTRASVPQGNNRLSTPLRIEGLNWSLITQPDPSTVGTTRTSVPEIALILGLITTALLTGMVRIGASAWRNARTIERLRISTAISSATDAVWEWEVGSGTLHRSLELWRHLGYEPAHMHRTLQEWLGLVHPDDRDRVAAAFAQIGEPGRETFEEEYRVATASGDWHTVVDRGRAVDRDPSGSVKRVMGITADVTASRRAQQELREVEALSGMGRVAARVAHEINNPLAGIRSAFTLIKDAVPLDHPHRHYVGSIEREVERIAGVTRQLYEVYRPEQEPGEASLSTIANDAVALLEQVNRSANVEIDVHLEDVPTVVPVSGALLRQIVYNLVQNAVDASPVGGTVDITGRVERQDLVLAVLDQGTGVPVELRQRIFEPFFTTKDATLRTSGMGLGLSMVARSVAAAGGTIDVDDAPGGGARFTVRLPLTNGGAAQ